MCKVLIKNRRRASDFNGEVDDTRKLILVQYTCQTNMFQHVGHFIFVYRYHGLRYCLGVVDSHFAQ